MLSIEASTEMLISDSPLLKAFLINVEVFQEKSITRGCNILGTANINSTVKSY